MQLNCANFYLQKAYYKYRMRRTLGRKKAGIDPIRTAFDQMKVYIYRYLQELLVFLLLPFLFYIYLYNHISHDKKNDN